MAEVAQRAGVNKATVSRAMKGDPRISTETRQKVWDAARELGYQLDAVASGLSSRRTGVMGLLVEDLRRPWLGRLLWGIHRVLERYKMEFLLVEAQAQRSALHGLRRLEGRKVDAVICHVPWDLKALDDRPLRIPLISVDGAGGDFAVAVEQQRTLAAVRALARGRPVRYRRGAQGAFAFLEALQDPLGQGAFAVWDGCCPDEGQPPPDLVCGDLATARRWGVPCLSYPAEELGILAARVATNVVRDRGVRPRCTLVRPVVLSPLGEPISESS